MDDLQFPDCFDNQVFHNLTLSKSIHLSIQPKLISAIEKTHRLPQSSFHSIPHVQSYPLILTDFINPNAISHSLPTDQQKPPSIHPRVQKAIQKIKETTVENDSPINVQQLFEQVQNLVNIKRSTKRAIKFIEVREGQPRDLFIQRVEWEYFFNFVGQGILVLPDGRKIKGNWRHASPQGNVTIQYPNQSVYYGTVNCVMQKQGPGYIYFRNGEKIETEFREGKMFGRGKYFDKWGKLSHDYRFDNGLMVSMKKA